MKTLHNLTPEESESVYSSFSLNFNTHVLNSAIDSIHKLNNAYLTAKLSRTIEHWVNDIDNMIKDFVDHENETKDNTSEDA